MKSTLDLSSRMDQILKTANHSSNLPKITDEMANEHPFLESLRDLYHQEDNSSPSKRALVTTLLKIYTKNVSALPISRRIIREDHNTDPNWKTKKSFDDEDYKPFLELAKGFHIRKITNYSNYKPSIFNVDEDCPVSPFFTGAKDEQLRNLFIYCEVTRTSFVDDATLEEFEQYLPRNKKLQ